MDMVTRSESRASAALRSVLLGVAISVAILSLALLAFTFFDMSARWIDFAGGFLFLVSGCTLLATVATALIGGFAQGRSSNADIRFVFRYLRHDAGWRLVVFGLLLAIALVTLVLFETSGVANGDVLFNHGRYVLTNDSGSFPISLAEFHRMSTARNIWYPTGAALLFANVAIIRMSAERHTLGSR